MVWLLWFDHGVSAGWRLVFRDVAAIITVKQKGERNMESSRDAHGAEMIPLFRFVWLNA